MNVLLDEFLKRLITQRKIIRKNMGPSIVPLAILVTVDEHFSKNTLLLTVDRKYGTIFGNRDLTKLYSAGPYFNFYSGHYKITDIRKPSMFHPTPLLEIHATFFEQDLEW